LGVYEKQLKQFLVVLYTQHLVIVSFLLATRCVPDLEIPQAPQQFLDLGLPVTVSYGKSHFGPTVTNEPGSGSHLIVP
jgi:hypothetical protein